MRYFKGSVKLNLDRDNALLKQVLHSGFVSQQQLWEFMALRGHESGRRCFNWRLKRLTDHGFIERHVLPNVTASYVYSLTDAGVRGLINLQQCHTGAVGFYQRKAEGDSVVHALDLNDIRLALARAGLLAGWKSDLEIRSQNEFTDYGYAKDYDAVLKLRLDGREVELALEYERHPKTQERYLNIAAAMQSERRIGRFLYLFPDYHLLWFVRRFFQHSSREIYFGVSCDFKRELISTQVVDPTRAYGSLAEALRG
ncbi:MAG: hypothetical protein ACRD18_09200 [Terriglobia bacterium]